MASEMLVGPVPSSWEYTTIGAACMASGGDVQTGPFGSQLHASDYVSVGVPSIMPKNIGDNRISEDGIARTTSGNAQRLGRYLVRAGDIVYSRRGDVERRALIREHEDGWLCGTGCLRIRFGDGGINGRYASYYLGHPNVREWIVRHAHGATMPNLNTAILSACPFVSPPKHEQCAIAHILGTLDDKIELNRQRNETLEAMARALFKDWFVDFGPVRAKMEGREPYLPPDIWQLFPDRIDDEGTPEGWDLRRVDDSLTLQRGFDLPASERTHGKYPVMAASGVNGYHDRFKVKGPGITTGRSGVLGRVFYVHEDFWPLNTSLWVKEFKKVSPTFAFHFLRGLDLEMFNAGSAVPTLNRNHVHNLPAIIPPRQFVHAFDAHVIPIMTKQKANEDESQSLSTLRDTLLPKLISGELRITDAEQFLQRAGV